MCVDQDDDGWRGYRIAREDTEGLRLKIDAKLCGAVKKHVYHVYQGCLRR